MVAVDEWRECKKCHDRMPLDVHHFNVTYTRKDGRRNYRHECRQCKARLATERDRRLRYDPATREQYLAARRETVASYMASVPEKVKQWREADKERFRKDPERQEHYRVMRAAYYAENADRIRENARMRWRLKAEREGRTIAARPVLQGSARKREPIHQSHVTVPAEPVCGLLMRLIRAYGATEAAAMAGVSPRLLHHVTHEAGAVLSLDSADVICTRLGFNLFDFWPEL